MNELDIPHPPGYNIPVLEDDPSGWLILPPPSSRIPSSGLLQHPKTQDEGR